MIVSSNQAGFDRLGEVLNEVGLTGADRAESASAAYALLTRRDYVLLLINAPLTDEVGLSLAEFAVKEALSGVVLVLKKTSDAAFERMERRGVMMVEKPVNRQLLIQAIRHARAFHGRLKQLAQENEKLRLKLDETKTVNRAKAKLMIHLNMTEDQAHRYIEKQAMDLRIPRMEVAKNILKNYMS